MARAREAGVALEDVQDAAGHADPAPGATTDPAIPLPVMRRTQKLPGWMARTVGGKAGSLRHRASHRQPLRRVRTFTVTVPSSHPRETAETTTMTTSSTPSGPNRKRCLDFDVTRGPVDRGREHECLVGKLEAERVSAREAALPVRGQERDGLGVERDAPVLVGLGALLPRPAASLTNAPLELDHAGVELKVAPAEAAELTATEASDHRQPDEQAPLRIIPGLAEDPGGLLSSGRLRVGLRLRRRFGLGDGLVAIHRQRTARFRAPLRMK